MTVKDLIEKLQNEDPRSDVVYEDMEYGATLVEEVGKLEEDFYKWDGAIRTERLIKAGSVLLIG